MTPRRITRTEGKKLVGGALVSYQTTYVVRFVIGSLGSIPNKIIRRTLKKKIIIIISTLKITVEMVFVGITRCISPFSRFLMGDRTQNHIFHLE